MLIIAEKDQPGRTIVVSSAVFHGDYSDDIATQALTGDVLAIGVEEIDPSAWFFILGASEKR